ncbi:MAG: bifunctional proline dehydrogenase/L-glutamate gamma-semialdehyde dehydrogenase, partial [Pirellulales bacterium]
DSPIMPIAGEQTLTRLCDRLERLYRAAGAATFTTADGRQVPKLLYLDMEEYRDLSLTAEAFMRTLSRPGLAGTHAGIALQAYVPDSLTWLKKIAAWSKSRVADGGVAVTVRIVKGANMEMERIDAALHGWPLATYDAKLATDASYKEMLAYALEPEHRTTLRVGVASHNLFDVAYGLVLAEHRQAGDRVQFEMLEGMANHQRRALLAHTNRLLLYAPACRKEDFLNAIGYLIRRLDENTGPENFLSHAFRLEVGSAEWQLLEQGFRQSLATEESHTPNRTQNRTTEQFPAPSPEQPWYALANEPDTDWSLADNASWAASIAGRDPSEFADRTVPVVVAGQSPAGLASRPCHDPSRPGSTLCQHRVATEREVDDAVACAVADPDGWRNLSVDARSDVLGRVAQHFRQSRGNLLRLAMLEGGKLLAEADPEVSEAIDFVEFYRATARSFFKLPSVSARGCGTVVVVPPWNFPIAIPGGGIAASLAAGNTVILKPASDAVLTAHAVCECFWNAGVSRRTLQFLPCSGSGPGQRLVAHPHVSAVILTGGTATALTMLKHTPHLRLSAETGGKNASIVTAMSDRELAIKHVVHSAFSHSGQKCSATSLLLLEGEVYDDPAFERMLCDAVTSLHVGSAADLHTRVTPLIRPPAGDLATGLTTLEPGERWAVRPQQQGDHLQLWSPGVKYGVRPGSLAHTTEFFGPLLGVMRYEQLS